MTRATFAVPGDLATVSGGYAYDRRVIAELRHLGGVIETVGLGDGFPFPSADVKARANDTLAALPSDTPVVIDGLALGALPEAAAMLCARTALVALVHHPLALETGMSAAQAEALRASECAALTCAHAVVVTSAQTAQILTDDYGVAADRITVAPPGTDRVEVLSTGSSDGIVRLLSVGAVVPRKGFDVLVAALARIADLPWRLVIAGDRTRDAATAAQLDAEIARHRLGDRIEILGAVGDERLAALYTQADLFVLASRYEGYGMAYAEAVAHGLPVIGTTSGGIPSAVPPGAGVLVAPDDVDALTQALRRLIGGADEHARLAIAARQAAATLPTWRAAAQTIASVIEGTQ